MAAMVIPEIFKGLKRGLGTRQIWTTAVIHHQKYNNFSLNNCVETKLTTAWIMSAGERDRTLMQGNGVWSSWGPWSKCSVTCGRGYETRRRTCTNYLPRITGRGCQGLSTDIQPCYRNSCPILTNGGWSHWGAWGKCSVTCGGGSQTRWRSCNNPPPSNGGHKCRGPETHKRSCNTNRCPSKKGL
ncbi:thrombospondin-1-like [Oculina patagonica]